MPVPADHLAPRILEQSPGHYRLKYSLPPDLKPENVQSWLESALDRFLAQEQRELWDFPQIESQTTDSVVVLTRTYPPVQLPALALLSLHVPPVQTPTEDLLQSHLIAMQYRLAQAKSIEGPAQAGDRVQISYYLEALGMPLPGCAAELNGLLRDDLIGPGFYTHLLGHTTGVELRIAWKIEKTPHAEPGQTGPVVVVLQLHKLERLTLPPLDDGFPALSGLGQNWQAFFLALHQHLQNDYEQQWRGFVRQALAYLLAEEAQIAIPADLFAAHQLHLWQTGEGKILAAMGVDPAQQRAAFEAWSQEPQIYAEAYADLKASLALRELLKTAQIHLSPEEIGILLQPYAETLRMPIEKVHAALAETGALQTLLDQALSEKALDLLLSQVQLISPELKPA